MVQKSPVEYYAERVLDRAQRRRLIEQSQVLVQACTYDNDSSQVILEASKLHRLAVDSNPEARKRCIPGRTLLDEYVEEARKPLGRRLMTYIPTLDRNIGGLRPGEVLTIIARPRVGKSALASQISISAARSDHRVVFFSLEMPRLQTFERMMMQTINRSSSDIERLAKDCWKDLTSVQQTLILPITERVAIVDRGKSGIGELEVALLEAEAVLGGSPALVVIDYLGLLCGGSTSRSVYDRVSEAAVDVKSFAKTHDLAVILLSQAGRDKDLEKSEGAARLGIDAARDSGQIEEAADFIVTMWRPELSPALTPEQRTDVTGDLECSLVKNRRGRIGDFSLRLDPTTIVITSREL